MAERDDMIGLFAALGDALGTTEAKSVARFEQAGLVVDTAWVSDGIRPFDTLVMHPRYNDGEGIIVQAYDTHEGALAGHDEWVRKMTGDPLPEQLIGCCNCTWLDTLCGASQNVYPREEQS